MYLMYVFFAYSRVFAFQEGDKGSKETATAKGIAKIFGKGISSFYENIS